MSLDIAKRFARDTADHGMTVLHDDGLYRHIRCQKQVWRPPLVKPLKSSCYWFELITVPGSLIFRGDGESFVFARLEDMFEFFRSSAYGEPNVGYWAEKVTSDQNSLKSFDADKFISVMKENYLELVRERQVPTGTSKALLEWSDGYDLTYEQNARDFLNDFEHKGFRFHDTWEWSFQEYDWWFLWALHGILWGIGQYDATKAVEVAEPEEKQ